jgi:type IV secretory pathway VirB9-like protein
MNHPLTLPVLGLLISMTALPALSETAPKPGSRDARVTYATYQEGQVYRINTRLRNVTLVELGEGEKISRLPSAISKASKSTNWSAPTSSSSSPWSLGPRPT